MFPFVSLVLFLFSSAYLAYSVLGIAVSGYTQDFQQYFEAALMIRQNLDPYQTLLTSAGPFNYPPPVLFFLYPFSYLSVKNALFVWTVLSFMALIFSIYLLLKLIPAKLSLAVKFLIYTAVFFSFPVKFTFGMGQINHFVLLFLTLVIFLDFKKKFYLSGLFAGLAALIKISPLILVPYYLLTGKFKQLFSMILTIITLVLFSFFAFGDKIMAEYAKIFLTPLNFSDKAVYYNQSLVAFFSRLSIPPPVAIFFLATLILLAFSVILLSANRYPPYSLLLSLMLLVSPISWQHHFVFLIPAFILTLSRVYQTKTLPQTILYFLLFNSYFLIAVNIKNPGGVSIFPALILSHVSIGALTLFFLNLWLSLYSVTNTPEWENS